MQVNGALRALRRRLWSRAAPTLGGGLLLATLAPALPALAPSSRGHISLVAGLSFLLSAGLLLLAGVAHASYDRILHPYRLGRLSDAWLATRANVLGCLTAGNRAQFAWRTLALSTCFFVVWLIAHAGLRGLTVAQAAPSVTELVAAITLGLLSWLVAAGVRSRWRWAFVAGTAGIAWWCLRNLEATMRLAGESTADRLEQLIAGPFDPAWRDRWLASAPALGPLSLVASLALALFFVRAIPEVAVKTQRRLLGWAALSALCASAAACLRQ
jgi:hypothetical protein